MNKAAIQRFAVWARREMLAQVSQRAYQYGITAEGYGEENAIAVNGRVLSPDEQGQRRGLVAQIKKKGFSQVMEEVAYTWFNRFIALRFMEVNNYLPGHIRVFTDAEGAFKPKILAEALHLEMPGLDRDKVAGFIERNQTDDLYRYLLLTQCNVLNVSLPRMFERMGSYTELLLPNNILRPEGILGRMIADIPEEYWTDQVQIIGWLYQYYNAELKDETFALLKKNIKVTRERLPSATQLFTPDWIVRYMVENSLGRIYIDWRKNAGIFADGRGMDEMTWEEFEAQRISNEKMIADDMGWKYYLPEAEQSREVRRQLDEIQSEHEGLNVKDIKVIDPCMGSGHILVYAFDVLVQIYRQAGVSERDAAQSILQNNLYGLDIDDRAAQLAYFAVMMKARQYDRRILSRGIQPHLHSTAGFDEGREYGSLLIADDPGALPEKTDIISSADLDEWNVRHILAQKYDVVVTNPPYMGAGNMNGDLAGYVKKYYPDEKSDLFACFIRRGSQLVKHNGYNCVVTMQSWMFLSSFEKMRVGIMASKTITNLMHMENMVLGIAFGTAVTVFWNNHVREYKGTYNQIKLCDIEDAVPKAFPIPGNRFAQVSTDSFSKIPGSPVAYWVSRAMMRAFEHGTLLGKIADSRQGVATADNNKYLRLWYEVRKEDIKYDTHSHEESLSAPEKWYPYNKGGEFRKWYGNNDFVVNWKQDGSELRSDKKAVLRNTGYYFRPCFSWSLVSSGVAAFRYKPHGQIFDVAGMSCFSNDSLLYLLGLANSKVVMKVLEIVAPTINYQCGDIANIPVVTPLQKKDLVESLVRQNITVSRTDWDSFETSWDFQFHPMVPVYADDPDYAYSVEAFFEAWKDRCQDRFDRLKANEEELNRIFIDIYGLQDELTPEVEDKDVTVRPADLGRDVRSLISYAVGCMFGRYSADGPAGLICAGGEWDPDRYGRFAPDEDNIIPICDDEYFDDDIVGRFVQWLEVVYGRRSLEENLKFIADALGGRGAPREVIRSYFLNDFYADHLKIYQKRPIYWLFDSGRKNGFKALIYMHRYQSDLLARMRTDYVHEQQERYRTQLRHIGDAMRDAGTSERVKLSRQQVKLQEQALELQRYEEKIHHLADQNIQIDLDDGVKHNYALFADVLAKI